MSFSDLFKSNQNKALRERVDALEALLTPEMRESITLSDDISRKREELKSLQNQISELTKEYRHQQNCLESSLSSVKQQIELAKKELVVTQDEALMQSFGMYTPRYSFANSTGYKDELTNIRSLQKNCIKDGRATTGNKNWTVDGDLRKGAKMVQDMQQLLLRAFNCECDDVIDHVKFNNVEAAEKRIQTAFSKISKLGSICGVAITGTYRNLKLQELHLAYEYQIEKQKEKDRLKELRAEERERAKLEKEIEAERKKLSKEASHYHNALAQINLQIAEANSVDLPMLERKKAELEAKIADTQKAIEHVDYRAANQKAGYVYIISNLGSFGEGIYKIGMTRRLEPMDRIDELGDASVPFDFDVHALIFSEDAPALEAALHRTFENRKLNMVNTRREFFRVSLDEIKAVVKEHYDKTVEFIDIPAAEQFRQSQLLRKKGE